MLWLRYVEKELEVKMELGGRFASRGETTRLRW